MLHWLDKKLHETCVAVVQFFVLLATIAVYCFFAATVIFWVSFTAWLTDHPTDNWNSFFELVSKQANSEFFTLLMLNPFVLVLTCTLTIVVTIWCHSWFFQTPKFPEKEVK
ncbi:MAG: hypothetical protein IJQ39_05135 [Thermoguttaceae bacterium]|nr:hypothetical protein [Thermoguttaceae bacterium]